MQLVYDRECPVCAAYCHSLKAALPGLRLVNAREDTPILREITRRGLDIDEGMVLEAEGEIFYGAAALQALAARATGGARSRVNRWVFGSLRRSRILYPALRSARNGLLKILRRTRINNLGRPNNERF
jgi:predicted DCC family thiol-disulfide oxidoreductase YuxK